MPGTNEIIREEIVAELRTAPRREPSAMSSVAEKWGTEPSHPGRVGLQLRPLLRAQAQSGWKVGQSPGRQGGLKHNVAPGSSQVQASYMVPPYSAHSPQSFAVPGMAWHTVHSQLLPAADSEGHPYAGATGSGSSQSQGTSEPGLKSKVFSVLGSGL